MKIYKEVTQWAVEYRQPNHVYLMHKDRVLAYSRWGESEPEYFAEPQRLDRRGRRFVEVDNIWNFRLDPVPNTDRTWSVTGSRGDQYTVTESSGAWSCTCSGFQFRGRCRHLEEIKKHQA